MGDVPGVAVSAVTGAGLPELTAALEPLLAGLPAADAGAPVRLWIDRAFTIRGAGTVVTGTLAAGTVAAGRPARSWATARSSCGACSRSASRSSGRRPPRGWR